MQANPNLPDNPAQVNTSPLVALRAVVTDFVESQTSKATQGLYRLCVHRFLNWYADHGDDKPITATTLKRYRSTLTRSASATQPANAAGKPLAHATRNLYLTVARGFLSMAAEQGIVSWEAVNSIRRIRLLPNSIVRPGCWLDLDKAEALLAAPDTSTLVGIRDKAVIGVLLGAGIRRSEVAGLQFEHFRHVENRWVIWRLVGKGMKVRDVPIPAWTKQLIDDWAAAANLPNTGPVFYRLSHNGKVTLVGHTKLRGPGIYRLVRDYAASIGLVLGPHDLRRTWAMLALKNGAPLRQIQFSMGHGSVAVTEKYLTRDQSFTDAPADRLGISLKPHTKRVVQIDSATETATPNAIVKRAAR